MNVSVKTSIHFALGSSNQFICRFIYVSANTNFTGLYIRISHGKTSEIRAWDNLTLYCAVILYYRRGFHPRNTVHHTNRIIESLKFACFGATCFNPFLYPRTDQFVKNFIISSCWEYLTFESLRFTVIRGYFN